jgi:hypothetical protein|tara:strand:+ start:31 stop:1371 length:1341 start_codon:yes stop_codon:yes gene_type:complete
MKTRYLISLILVSFASLALGQKPKLKKIAKTIDSFPHISEVYSVIKKGEHIGLKHGSYKSSQEGSEINGTYYFGQKDGEWKYNNNKDRYSEFYTAGKIDSSLGVIDYKHYRLILDQKNDTLLFETWRENGFSFVKTGDTTQVRNYLSKETIGIIINGRREGQWNWKTQIGTATTFYKDGKSTGSHTSYYNSGVKLCEKTYNEQGNLDGLYVLFYENGDTGVIHNYKNGKQHGLARSWFPNRGLYYMGNYSYGRLMSYTEFDKKGQLNVNSHVRKGIGMLTSNKRKYEVKNGFSNTRINQTNISPNVIMRLERMYAANKEETKNNPICIGKPYSKVILGYQTLDTTWSHKAFYPGTEYALPIFFAENIAYPVQALTNNIQGKVEVDFRVNDLGEASVILICNEKLGYGLEEEAMRIVQLSSLNWAPALLDGFPTSYDFITPILFQLF